MEVGVPNLQSCVGRSASRCHNCGCLGPGYKEKGTMCKSWQEDHDCKDARESWKLQAINSSYSSAFIACPFESRHSQSYTEKTSEHIESRDVTPSFHRRVWKVRQRTTSRT